MTARLHDWLSAQAELRPEATAVVFRGQTTTYRALEQASNRLARALKTSGCRAGDRVGLLLPKSARALIAMFGALKADCIYVPLDTTSPAARLERILERCECRVILAEQSTAALLDHVIYDRESPVSERIGWVDEGEDSAARLTAFRSPDVESLSGEPVESRSTSSDAAHILFTSGSTGLPKGVVIQHANVIQFVEWAVKHFGMGPEDRVSGHPPLHFDLSTFDIYGTIAAGAQIHLLPPELSLLPRQLAEFIREARLTQWFSAPSVLLPMAKADVIRQDDFPALRRLLWCGEKFPVPALMYWMRRLPHADFVNLYGPTEATIASSFYHVAQPPLDEKAEIPIGEACAGESLLVLDEQLNPAKPGEVGDLYIGGAGLSPGYWREPEKTKQVFLANPFAANPDERIYKTGDLARTGPDGMIYLVGRMDSQIKLSGHRIELGEIEAAVHATPGIEDAAVVAIESESGEKAICCAYIPSSGVALPPIALKKAVSASLPRYMIPSQWMTLERMPHNANGKTDRVLLKKYFSEGLDPQKDQPHKENAFVATGSSDESRQLNP